MEYTLENLHKLIQAISPEVIKSTELSQQTIDDWIAIAVNERESVQVRLMKDIFSIPNEKALEIYIANCQSTLIGLADNLTACTKHFSKKDKLFGLYQEILVVIKSLLTFIEHHFTRYFNLDAKVPESYYRVEQTEIKKKIENVKFALNKLNVENVLIEILLQPLTTFVNENGGIGVTYRKLIYLKELLQEIKSFTDNSTVENNTSEFVSLLLYLNFNHLLFLNFFYKYDM